MKVKDFMVPLDDYATVNEGATLEEALQALEEAQESFDQKKYKHRAILVLNKKGKVVGKISQLQSLMGLEKYGHLSVSAFSRHGYTSQFLDNMMGRNLWDIETQIKLGGKKKVEEFMHAPTKGEFITDDSSLEDAIHMLVTGGHQSLLVLGSDRNIVGIVRLADVFDKVWRIMKKQQAK